MVSIYTYNNLWDIHHYSLFYLYLLHVLLNILFYFRVSFFDMKKVIGWYLYYFLYLDLYQIIKLSILLYNCILFHMQQITGYNYHCFHYLYLHQVQLSFSLYQYDFYNMMLLRVYIYLVSLFIFAPCSVKYCTISLYPFSLAI